MPKLRPLRAPATSAFRSPEHRRRQAHLVTAGIVSSLLAGCPTGTLSPSEERLGTPARCSDPWQPDGCGTACTADSLCGTGLHCANGACIAECDPTGAEGPGCDGDEVCSDRGRCGAPAGMRDAGPERDANDDGCAEVTLELDPETPTVVLVVDRSTSMRFEFRESGLERWDALDGALFAESTGPGDPGGVVVELADRARFAMYLYTGATTADPPVCPALSTVAAALDDADDLARVYRDNRPVRDSNTPTSEALEEVLAATSPSPDGPTLFLLATDGRPDLCAEPTERNLAAREASIAEVQRIFDAGYETFVLSLADFDDRHAQDLANAGQGLPVRPESEGYRDGDPLADPFTPLDTEGLRADIRNIVGGSFSCEVTLNGRIDTARGCDGVVRLDGVDVPCDADGSGWRVLDEQTIELLGTACEDLRSGRVVTVQAPEKLDHLVRLRIGDRQGDPIMIS